MVSRFFEGEVWLCLLINVTALVYAQLDGERCCKEGDGNNECGGQLKTVGKTLSRAGDFFVVCTGARERHHYKVLWEGRRCSWPSS